MVKHQPNLSFWVVSHLHFLVVIEELIENNISRPPPPSPPIPPGPTADGPRPTAAAMAQGGAGAPPHADLSGTALSD